MGMGGSFGTTMSRSPSSLPSSFLERRSAFSERPEEPVLGALTAADAFVGLAAGAGLEALAAGGATTGAVALVALSALTGFEVFAFGA